MFGIRGIFKNKVLIKGLFFSENKETIPDECLVECSGFILSQGLLKKDHNLVLCSDVPDNIAYYAGGNLPICIAGSEVDPEDQEDPPTPSEDVAEYDPDDDEDFDWSYVLAWVSGQMTSMSSGETKYLEVTGNVGETFWSVDLSGFTGTLEHKKVSNVKSIYKASSDASGSFTVIVHDAFNDLNRTISINGILFGLYITSITTGSHYYMVFDSKLNYIGLEPISNYSYESLVSDIRIRYSSLGINPTISKITDNGETIIGPYIYHIPEQPGDGFCYARLQGTYEAGSISTYELFQWNYTSPYGTVTYKSYIYENGINTTILDTNIYGFIETRGVRTQNYLMLCGMAFDLYALDHGFTPIHLDPYFYLKVMDSSGNTVTNILSDNFVVNFETDQEYYYPCCSDIITIQSSSYWIDWSKFRQIEKV